MRISKLLPGFSFKKIWSPNLTDVLQTRSHTVWLVCNKEDLKGNLFFTRYKGEI